MKGVIRFFNLEDKEYSDLVESCQAITKKEKVKYIVLHLLPGLAAYIFIYFLRIPLTRLFNMDTLTYQVIVLLTMALGWHIGFPFFVLMKKDKLSFSESLKYLGLKRLDFKGILTLLPLTIILFTLISAPYIFYVHPILFNFLNSIPIFTIQDWHIYSLGYGYDFFPWYLLIVVFMANFLGEEIYFRGFLLNKMNAVKGNGYLSNFLFMMYHVWQVPLNWAYAPAFFLIPYPLLVKLRKNIYISIVFHMFINLAWYQLADFIFQR